MQLWELKDAFVLIKCSGINYQVCEIFGVFEVSGTSAGSPASPAPIAYRHEGEESGTALTADQWYTIRTR